MTFDKRILVQAQVSLFHAMNLGGFAAYVRAGAVLCREDLLVQDSNAAPFRSDEPDRARGLLGRTFGNLADFGTIHARAYRTLATPNIYGPIQIQFPPRIWTTLSDVVLTRTSVMFLGENWRAQSINGACLSVLVDGCISGVPQHPYAFTEASASDRSIPLSACHAIIVEPIAIQQMQLADIVRQLVAPLGISARVVERTYSSAATESIARLQAESDGLFDCRIDLSPGYRLNYDNPPPWMVDAIPSTIDRWGQWATNYYLDTVQYVRRQQQVSAPAMEATDAAFAEAECDHDFDEHLAFQSFWSSCAILGRNSDAEAVCDVFRRHFIDPADGVPYDSEEGGYQYIFGGPYEPDQVLREALEGKVAEATLSDAISRLRDDNYDWIFREQY